MHQDTQLIELYSSKLLELSTQIPHLTPLDAPGFSAKARAPLCGSYIEVAFMIDKRGAIDAFYQDVKACVLGQATAALVGQVIIGLTQDIIQQGYNDLLNMLENKGAHPSTPFEGLYILEPAREFENRHASILLIFQAILNAFNKA